MNIEREIDRLLWRFNLLMMESRRGIWFFVGHLGVAFKIIPRLRTRLMIKRGAKKGVRVSQFGPLVLTWEERA